MRVARLLGLNVMMCHECAMVGEERPAVALCKFCYVGLCKEHLMALYHEPRTVPQYSCRHDPAGRPNRPIFAEAGVREEVFNRREVAARS